MDNQNTQDSIVAYLAAIAPALLQLIAVVSVGLVDVLRLETLVLMPEYINLANFFAILISVSLISLASFWDYNKIALLNNGENLLVNTKKYWNLLKLLFIVLLASSGVFLYIISTKDSIQGDPYIWIYIQWGAYILSMVSVSFLIYSYALLKIQEKRNRLFQENYVPRLLDSLRRYGHVNNPDIQIHQLNRETRKAIVKLGGNSKYLVETDWTGEMISISCMSNQNGN